MVKGTRQGPERCGGVGRAGHPSWVGKTGRPVREGFPEEVAAEPRKGQSLIQGRRGGRAWRAARRAGARKVTPNDLGLPPWALSRGLVPDFPFPTHLLSAV